MEDFMEDSVSMTWCLMSCGGPLELKSMLAINDGSIPGSSTPHVEELNLPWLLMWVCAVGEKLKYLTLDRSVKCQMNVKKIALQLKLHNGQTVVWCL